MLFAAAALAGEPYTFVPSAPPSFHMPSFGIALEGATVRVRNTAAVPLLLDGIALVDPGGWTVPHEVPSLVPAGEEITVELDGVGEPPATILVRTGSGVGQIHPLGLAGVYAEPMGIYPPAERAVIQVAAGAARRCVPPLSGTDDRARLRVGFGVGTDGRAEVAWVQETSHRSGAIEQCVLDAVRDPELKYPRSDEVRTYSLDVGFQAVRNRGVLVAKRWDDVLVLVNVLDRAVVVEEIDVVDGEGLRVDVDRPVRIPAERQRTFAVHGERPAGAQLLIRTSVGVQVEPDWQPPAAGGALLQADIDRVLAAGTERIQACRTDPKLEGAVSVRLAVAADGTVSEASVRATSLPSGPVEQCVLDGVRALRFPAPTGGGPVPVATAFVFP